MRGRIPQQRLTQRLAGDAGIRLRYAPDADHGMIHQPLTDPWQRRADLDTERLEGGRAADPGTHQDQRRIDRARTDDDLRRAEPPQLSLNVGFDALACRRAAPDDAV